MGKRQRKEKRKLKRKAKKQRRLKFAEKLKNNTPKSELWFYSLYETYKSGFDEYNTVFAGYIPDVINKKQKYIIEVDGSIHQLEHIKRKDLRKTKRFQADGYKVIRIEAYNIESFNEGMKILSEIRGEHWKPVKFLKEREIKQLY